MVRLKREGCSSKNDMRCPKNAEHLNSRGNLRKIRTDLIMADEKTGTEVDSVKGVEEMIWVSEP